MPCRSDEVRDAGITERLWTEFHARLRKFVISHLHDEHAADDVLQDIFLKVHKSIGSLRDEAKIGAWLYTIARNAITDHYRQRPMEPLDPELEIETASGTRSAEQSLAVSLGLRINRLPERYREAVVLTGIDGLTQAEMAERLHLSLSGGKSRVQRAREMLKRGLLECCRIEFDRCGGVISYEERSLCRGCGK